MSSDETSEDRRDHMFDAPADEAEDTLRPETYGIVEITRHVKDDGRALLLYSRRGDPPG